MGFFIGSSDKQQEDNDMLLYVEDAEGIIIRPFQLKCIKYPRLMNSFRV
jgi:hypothetical protein